MLPAFSTNFTAGIDANMTLKNFFLRTASGLVLSTFLVSPFQALAQTPISQAVIREKALKNASTPSDSVRILLEEYNITDKVNRDKLRVQIINLAEKSDNNEVISDVLKELSTSTDDTESLARLIEISESIKGENHKENLRTVLVMEKAISDFSTVADSNSQSQMVEYMRQGMSITSDPYKEMQNIYRALVYLGSYSQGPLYFEFIKRLEELVEQLPEEEFAMRNLYYTTAALFYTRKRDYRKALENDWALIQELDKIKSRYTDQNQAEKDLAYFYYVSFRRMLRNFKGLNPEQIEKVYQRCLQYAKLNEKAAEEFGNGGLTNSYYYMATKQYGKAIPELQKALAAPNISEFRKGELLGHLAFAMRNTGDKQGELEALREYSAMLLADRTKRRDDMYKEIELRNSVNKILLDEYKDQEKLRKQNGVMRKTSITLVYVLAIILIFLCGSYLRLRRRVKILESKNNKLHRNIADIFDDGVPKGAHDIKQAHYKLKG